MAAAAQRTALPGAAALPAQRRMHGAAAALPLRRASASLAARRLAPAAAAAAPAPRRALRVEARYGGGAAGGGGYRATAPNVGERVLAAAPFLLPFLDAFSYGRFLFYMYPLIARAVAPFAPLLQLYHSIPFAALIAFFGIYLGVVNNARLPRFVRFSAMQAVLLDILLVLPRLLEQLISPPSAPGLALQAYITAQNTIWIAVAACVAFGMGSALLGREVRLPFIGDAAEAQLR
ncbi:hypothetical protein Rsub_06002 [Raphidocelis subcapitata]|uniref:Protein TIC 20 n=1 Tax=Raphidocelis subcapitata TaxID=307507 RepID=A0A2V0P5Y5_9CHLO|nr:hypothetical protein Rsub_06002 [Raphidocelis subcapitata]|eukprot:GBF93270.1 hypothetical protein Rsub_06002 [Raphidocelis subcapitata]